MASAPFWALHAGKSENPAIEPPRAEILQSNPPPPGGAETPLYLGLGRQKGLGRGLVHPWSQGAMKIPVILINMNEVKDLDIT